MAVFKVPRISTAQRLNLMLEASEIVFDTDELLFYGGNGILDGGFPIGSGIGNNAKEQFKLTQNDIDNKRVQLSTAPRYPDLVSMTIIGGIDQVNGVDFEVIGDYVSWDGLGLDGFLEKHDIIIIQY